LVSYGEKHNEANQENNHDGRNENYSANYGVEGQTDDPAVVEVREQQKRNLLATLLLSQGTPMLLAGDEIGRTQQGNNNAYCQDNGTSWTDCSRITERDEKLLAFARRLIAFRKAHPVLRHLRFLHGRATCARGIRDITWYAPQGTEKTTDQWQDVLAR